MSITVSQQFVKVFDCHENDPLLLFWGFCFCFLGFFLLYFFWGGVLVVLLCFVCLYCFVLFWFLGVFWGFFFGQNQTVAFGDSCSYLSELKNMNIFTEELFSIRIYVSLVASCYKVMCSCIYLFLLCVRIDFESRCQCINSKTR